jgi:hypothetical protein
MAGSIILLFAVISHYYVFSINREFPRKKFNIETYSNYKKTNGFDHRPPLPPLNITDPFESIRKTSPQNKTEQITKIRGFFKKKRILDILQNPSIPIPMKIEILGVNDMPSLVPNILAGGLMSEWDFDFF